jgi:hypothetical protein
MLQKVGSGKIGSGKKMGLIGSVLGKRQVASGSGISRLDIVPGYFAAAV